MFTRYANLTKEQKQKVIARYRGQRLMGSDPGHAAACAAHDVLLAGDDRKWNSKIGSDAYAAVAGLLLLEGLLVASPTEQI